LRYWTRAFIRHASPLLIEGVMGFALVVLTEPTMETR
jgi:hypothetical protein